MSAWIANLPIRHKFLLLCLIALFMVATPVALVLRAMVHNLQTIEAERLGLPPTRDVLTAVKLLQEHRGLSNAYLNGDDSRLAVLQARRRDVTAALTHAGESLTPLRDPGPGRALQALAADWETLAQEVAQGQLAAPLSVQRHTELVMRAIHLVEDVAAVSGLSLDPEAESYFLIQALTRDIPRLTEQLGLARARGTAMLVREDFAPEPRQALRDLRRWAVTYADDAKRNLARAAARRDQEGDVSELDARVQAAQSAVTRGVGIIDHLLDPKVEPDMASTAYFDALTEVIADQFALSEVAMKRLGALLDQRALAHRAELSAMGVVVALALALGGAVAVVVTRTTTRAMRDAMQAAQALAEGDLTVHLRSKSRDEVGHMVDALGRAVYQMRGTIEGIKAASDSVATASSQIAQGNLDLSARTESQASSVQQTASSMEQMAGAVDQNAGTAREANALADAAAQDAARSGEAFSQVLAKMAEIKQTSARIAEINGVIDGIAFQTNILALNAAVEAARAGEQGRGFAVVAGEVRTLAQRSAQAAREIKGLIHSSVDSVEQGYELATHSSASVERLIEQVQRVSQLMSEIAGASVEQSHGIAQVNQAVTMLDQTTQQNAALVEESSAAAASLHDQAARLQSAVGRFRLA
jgi:methyl-accepting chemotaxis protein